MSNAAKRTDRHDASAMWACGGTCGQCPRGPSRLGVCRGEQAACRPRLTMYGYRRLFTAVCLLASVALLLAAGSNYGANGLVKPGPLSSAHSLAVSGKNIEQQCQACHAIEGANLNAWLASVVQTGGTSQVEKCLQCHGQTMAPVTARSPHNLSASFLAELTRRKEASLDSANEDWLTQAFNQRYQADVACSACHREHGGSHVKLTDLSNEQCQACHARQFHSFADHAEFSYVPRGQRASLSFNHVLHAERHFAEKQQVFKCELCHMADASGNVQRLRSFDQACASCHAQPLNASLAEGLVMTSLPTLNLESLEQSGSPVGQWPTSVQGDFDGELSPVLVLLLQGDEQAHQWLARWPSSFDLQTMHDGQLPPPAVAEIAIAIKRLWADLAHDAEGTWRDRLSYVARRPITLDKTVARELQPSFFQLVQRSWFDQWAGERRRWEKPKSSPSSPLTLFKTERSRSKEILAENPLVKLMPDRTSSASTPQAPPVNVPSNVPSESLSTRKNGDAKPTTNVAPTAAPRGELLSENPLRTLMPRATEPAPSQPTIETNVPMMVVEEVVSSPEKIVETTSPDSTKSREVIASSLDWHGTWNFDGQTATVRYQAVGHADPLLKAMIDAAAAGSQSRDDAPLKNIQRLTSAKLCLTCHRVEERDQSFVVRWEVRERDPQVKGFTRFSHRPHVLSADTASCQKCHALDRDILAVTPLEASEAASRLNDFQTMTKSTCIQCHNASTQGDRCTQCHHYHITTPTSSEGITPERLLPTLRRPVASEEPLRGD